MRMPNNKILQQTPITTKPKIGLRPEIVALTAISIAAAGMIVFAAIGAVEVGREVTAPSSPTSISDTRQVLSSPLIESNKVTLELNTPRNGDMKKIDESGDADVTIRFFRVKFNIPDQLK
jgi:hypothetical protein